MSYPPRALARLSAGIQQKDSSEATDIPRPPQWLFGLRQIAGVTEVSASLVKPQQFVECVF